MCIYRSHLFWCKLKYVCVFSENDSWRQPRCPPWQLGCETTQDASGKQDAILGSGILMNLHLPITSWEGLHHKLRSGNERLVMEWCFIFFVWKESDVALPSSSFSSVCNFSIEWMACPFRFFLQVQLWEVLTKDKAPQQQQLLVQNQFDGSLEIDRVN